MSRPPTSGRPAANGYRSDSNPPNPSIAATGGAMTSQTQPGSMSRAERFEDEKRRIIESCFSKLDQNGQLAESYITHIRVMEDGAHPSAPPPPDSPPENRKPRLVIIAVRSTGRVRMHKARENNNGSFSIGKTWNLEDLTAIESFSNTSVPPQSEQEADYRARAGSVGFIVTITKPYYWQAGTPKEKEFFIASAVKIYRKYTKGEVPDLVGFDENQKAAMLGAVPAQQQSPPPAPRTQNGIPSDAPAPPQPPFAQNPRSRNNSRDHSRYRESPGPPGSVSDRDAGIGSVNSSRAESPGRFAPPPPIGVPRPFASSEHLRTQSPSGARPEPPRPSTSTGPGPSGLRSPPPSTSQPSLGPSQKSSRSHLRSESPANLSISSGREGPFKPPPNAAQSTPPRKPSLGQSMESVPQERQIPTNGVPDAPKAPQQRSVDDSVRASSPSLPPIETSPPSKAKASQLSPPHSAEPKTGESNNSSPGIGDPSAFASVAGFMGPDHSTAGAAPTVNEPEPSGPPTPPRSKRRPTLETAMSDSNIETLRPAPLRAQVAQRSATPEPFGNQIAQRSEDATSVSHAKTNSDSNLPPPSLGQRSLGSSPLAAAATVAGDGGAAEDGADEEFRPGLGPMIKKKVVADRMKKAALAASAFKPRPGGAAEKILKAKAEREGNNEPDGITGVVPRPAAKKEEPVANAAEDLAVKEPPSAPPKVEVFPGTPTVEYDQPKLSGMDGTHGVQLHDEAPLLQPPEQQSREAQENDRIEQRQIRQPQVKVKRRSAQHERYLDALGVDRSLLADKCLDFEMMLHDFGWNDAALAPRALADMEADLRREQSRLDAGSWLPTPSQETNARQERENQVLSLLDKAIQECDEMDGLLTIYNVELNSLNDDIAYVEAQSQGLQVQAANQRNLHNELTNLVQTLSLDKRILEPIRHADLSNPRGIDDAEQGLKKLYQAIITIDPKVRSNPSGRPRSRNGLNEGNELSSMAAVRQKRDVYLQQSDMFCQRLTQHLDFTFTTSFNAAKKEALVPATGPPGGMRLNADAYTNARKDLWVYSPLILFSKELDRIAWQNILKTYNLRAKPLYADAFGQSVAGWKRLARKVAGDEGEVLFTAQEKEEIPASGGVVSSARKLTVKRSQTLAKTLRKASDERPGSSDGRNAGGMQYCEIFAAALDEMAPLVSQEQNFVVDLFHATSLETADFMDVVGGTPPEHRNGTNLIDRKPVEPDREMAHQVTGAMDEIFGFFTNELSKLLDWSVSVDPIQGVGVMVSLSRHSFYLQDSSQEFLVQLTDTLMSRLQNLFSKFVEEQIRAIEDTKVKIKKRKGVIAFMKIFPHFAAAVENTFASIGQADYEKDADSTSEVRRRVDEAYTQINRAMFDSLKVIAKESPTTAPQGPKTATDDPEDKEKLNYHVLIIENMNHYIEEVDDGGKQSVLAEWKGRAEMERAEALESYVGQVIRRPLGKLLEFLDSIDSVKASHGGTASNVTSRPSFTRKSARNVLSQYDSKEVRRGIDQLRTRIEKHFGHGDDEAISRALVALVCKECEKGYEKAISRTEDIVRELYPNTEGEKPVELDFSQADVQAGFRK